MTDWIDTYRARQMAEAEDRNAIDRIMMRSPWGRNNPAPFAPIFSLAGDAAGVAWLFGMLWAALAGNLSAAMGLCGAALIALAVRTWVVK